MGFLCGFGIGLWMFIGATLYGKPPADLPLSTDGCPEEPITDVFTSSVDGLVTSMLGTVEVSSNLFWNSTPTPTPGDD